MASISAKTFLKRMSRRGKQVERGVVTAKQKLAIEISSQLIFFTPVDEGFARGGWLAGLGSPASGSTVADRGGSATRFRNATTILKSGLNQVIYITNNIPYIGALDQGYSPQQSAGFVSRAIRNAERTFVSLPSIWTR